MIDFRFRTTELGRVIIDDNSGFVVRRNYVNENIEYDEFYDNETGEVLFSYYEDGYEYVSAMFSPRMMGKMNADSLSRLSYSVCASMVYLNKDEFDLENIEAYCKFLCSDVFSKGMLKIDFTSIWKNVLKIATNELQIQKRTAKFLWHKPFSYDQKMEYVRSHNGSVKRDRMNKMIEGAVTVLLEDNPPVFIISSEVSSKIKEMYGKDVPTSTVRNYLPQFEEEIHKHNITNFETHDFNIYQRACTVNNVVSAITAIAFLKEEITKSKVSKYSNVSYPSVLKLWEADEIQDVLVKYNSISK